MKHISTSVFSFLLTHVTVSSSLQRSNSSTPGKMWKGCIRYQVPQYESKPPSGLHSFMIPTFGSRTCDESNLGFVNLLFFFHISATSKIS